MKEKDRFGLNVSSYILLGLGIINSLAHAGFEGETKTYTEIILGNPFHCIAAVVFAYWSIPALKQSDWGGSFFQGWDGYRCRCACQSNISR